MEGQLVRHVAGIERTLRISAIGLLVIVSVWLLRDILLLGFAAVLIACVLRGASNVFQRRTSFGPRLSLLTVILATTVAVGAVLWWRGSAISDQIGQIGQQLSTQLERVWRELGSSSWGSVLARQLQLAGNSMRAGLTGYVPGVVGSVLGVGGSLIVTAATAGFLAASPQLYLRGALRLLPVTWRPRAREVATEIASTLQLWFLGQVVDMVVVAVLLGLGIFLLDVPLAFTLALLAGLLNFVPYVGALVGAIPAIFVALAQSPALAAWVGGLFLLVQVLEGNVIAPWIQKRTISLAPALTILSQTILGTLFGVIGLIVATPLMAAMVTAVRMVYVEGFLEKDDASRPEG